jgi:hypothetical protein
MAVRIATATAFPTRMMAAPNSGAHRIIMAVPNPVMAAGAAAMMTQIPNLHGRDRKTL